jgi:signal transduction histidine kinase
MVSVEDTGKGVELNDIEQIFNPFFTTKSHGMGMGLSICRSIIEAHEGRLWATPNGSQGAVFQFILPVDTSVPAGPPEESNPATSAGVNGRTATVKEHGEW